MHRIDGEGATIDNKFTEGNPTTGTLATEVTADWGNMVQEELAAVVEAAGIPLDKGDNTQLLQAIISLVAGGGSEVTAAGVSIADAAEYFAGTEVEAALQQIGAKVYTGNFEASQIHRSIIGINNSNSATEAAHAENVVVLTSGTPVTYVLRPDSAATIPVGGSITLSQGGAGKITVLAGTGVTIKYPAVFNPATLGQEATIVAMKTAADTWRLGGMLEAA